MYSMLQRNLTNYFHIQQTKDDKNYRLEVAQVLRALIDPELYQKWKVESPQKYKEVSNIVYQVQQGVTQFQRFETLARDLWGMEYEAIECKEFCNEDIVEQLKIINLCLGTAYWEEPSDKKFAT